MHNKDYELIAQTIKESPTLEELIERLIKRLKKDNPRFNEEKFRKMMRRK